MAENAIFQNKAKALLEQLGLIIQKQDDFKKMTGEAFNVFSILNMERLEVRTHSAFIFELLNPKGCHFQGELFLRTFIEEILNVEDFNYKNVVVERERSIGDLGRMDLVIENDYNLIIIEMKIDAGDQEKQLKRYNTYAKKSRKEYKIYYLTLFGYEASEESTGKEEEKIDYECLSFKSDIYDWIDKCIRKERVPILSPIRETLYQYLRLIEKITNKVDRGMLMEMKDVLLKDNNLEIVEKMIEVIPYAKAELEFKFWSQLYKKYNEDIEKLGIKFIDDGEFPHDKESTIKSIMYWRKSKNCGYWLEYLVGEYKDHRIKMCIGNSGYDKYIYMSIGLIDEKDCNVNYKEYDEKLVQTFSNLGFDKVGVYKYRYLNYDLNFYDNIYKLTSEDVLNEAVTCIGEELMKIVKKVSESKELNALFKEEK